MISNIASTALAEGLTVVFVPLTAGQKITDLSSVKVSQELYKQCPESILEVLCNVHLNLITVDTWNRRTTRRLLSWDPALWSTNINRYKPFSNSVISGMIKNLKNDLVTEEPPLPLRSEVRSSSCDD